MSDLKQYEGKLFERPCRYCGVIDSVIIEGKGPHLLGLKCTGCERHNGWLGHKAISTIVL